MGTNRAVAHRFSFSIYRSYRPMSLICVLTTFLGVAGEPLLLPPRHPLAATLVPCVCLRTSYKYIPTSRAEKSLGTFYKWPCCSIFGHTGREKHVGACRNYFGPPLSSPLTSYMISVWHRHSIEMIGIGISEKGHLTLGLMIAMHDITTIGSLLLASLELIRNIQFINRNL